VRADASKVQGASQRLYRRWTAVGEARFEGSCGTETRAEAQTQRFQAACQPVSGTTWTRTQLGAPNGAPTTASMASGWRCCGVPSPLSFSRRHAELSPPGLESRSSNVGVQSAQSGSSNLEASRDRTAHSAAAKFLPGQFAHPLQSGDVTMRTTTTTSPSERIE
jgi:hypothetical protein